MTASYALSRFKAFGSDALGLGATVTDLNNIRKEFGPAGLDRTHRFVLSGIYDVPFFRKSRGTNLSVTCWAGWQVSLYSTGFLRSSRRASSCPTSLISPGPALSKATCLALEKARSDEP